MSFKRTYEIHWDCDRWRYSLVHTLCGSNWSRQQDASTSFDLQRFPFDPHHAIVWLHFKFPTLLGSSWWSSFLLVVFFNLFNRSVFFPSTTWPASTDLSFPPQYLIPYRDLLFLCRVWFFIRPILLLIRISLSVRYFHISKYKQSRYGDGIKSH